MVLLPGAGDVRSENRSLAAHLQGAGFRVVSADLPGHGDSPVAARYGVEETATALIDLILSLEAGPATVVGVSFAPAAAIWVAADHPEQISAVVAISPHLEEDTSVKGRVLRAVTALLLRGPWAASLWERFYRSWYKENPPSDLDAEIAKLRAMLADPLRRRAARQTLLAHREGVDQRMDRLAVPALVVFGAADDHFSDPRAEARRISETLSAEMLMVDGAGHYPHVEDPDGVATTIVDFLHRVSE